MNEEGFSFTCEEFAAGKFHPLSKAEETLIDAIKRLNREKGNGETETLIPLGVAETHPDTEQVRAELLQWMLTDPKCLDQVKRSGGLRLSALWVTGQLSMEDVDADFAVVFNYCQFDKALRLERGKFRYLSLANSSCVGVAANGIHVDTDLVLSGLVVRGGMGFGLPDNGAVNRDSFAFSLDDARINGVVDCRGATFDNPEGYSLSLARSEIDGGCDLSETNNTGQVRLDDCRIRATLDCENAVFRVSLKPRGTDDYALSLERSTIGGHCLLRGKFEADGRVSLRHAGIGGDLDCRGARFAKPKRNHPSTPDGELYCLDVSHGIVRGSCLFGFAAEAMVVLRCLVVGGDLAACRAFSDNHAKWDFRSEIRRNFQFYNSFERAFAQSTSENLRSGRAFPKSDRLLVCSEGVFNDSDLGIDATQARITGSFDLRNTEWSGRIRFLLGSCGALMLSIGHAPRGSLELNHANCNVLFARPAAWDGLGSYDLEGFHYKAIEKDEEDGWEKYADWLRRSTTPKLPYPWEQLANVLRATGHGADARNILIKRESLRTRWSGTESLAKESRHWIYGAMVGYGHKPGRAFLAACRTFLENHAKWDLRSEIRRNFQFYNSFERAFAQSTSENLRSGRAFPKSDRLLGLAVLLAVGWLAVFYGDQHNAFFQAMDRVYVEKAQQRSPRFEVPIEYPRLEPFFYALDALVPFLDLDQEKYWLPNRTSIRGDFMQFFLWAYKILGWVLASFGVAAVTRLVKRD